MLPKLVVFDLNKTLIQESSWYELNLAMGITQQEDETLYRLGPEKDKIIGYIEWIDILKRIMIARGKASRDAIEKVILNYTINPEAQELVNTLKQRGVTVAIISGSFNIVVDDVARRLGIEHAYSNAFLVFDDNNMLEDIVLTWDDVRYKTLLVNSVCSRFGVNPEDIYYVADGDNDTEILKITRGIIIDIPRDFHEPWKKKAIDAGEVFLRDEAIKSSLIVVNRLSDVISVIDNS